MTFVSFTKHGVGDLFDLNMTICSFSARRGLLVLFLIESGG